MADGTITIQISADNGEAVKKLDETEQRGKKTFSAVGIAGKAAGVALAAAAVTAGKAAVEAFKDVEAGANIVKQATGRIGDDAEELIGVYKRVAGEVVGGFEAAAEVVGDLNTRLGLEGDELEGLSESVMKYAKVTGEDALSASTELSDIINNMGLTADDGAALLDTLTVAEQASGIGASELSKSLNANADTFKQMGISVDEGVAMLATFEKTGANTSGILAGMKKGVAAWAKEGKSASEGFKAFTDGVKDGTVKASDAIDMFGSRAGVTMYEAAKKGQLDFSDMYDAISSSSEGALDSMYEDTLTASERIQLCYDNMALAAAEVLAPAMEDLEPIIDVVCEALQNLAIALESGANPTEAFSNMVSEALNYINDSFSSADVSGALESMWDNVKSGLHLGVEDGELTNVGMEIGTKLINGAGEFLREHAGELVTALADGLFNAVDIGFGSFFAGLTGQDQIGHILDDGEFTEVTIKADGTFELNTEDAEAKIDNVKSKANEVVSTLSSSSGSTAFSGVSASAESASKSIEQVKTSADSATSGLKEGFDSVASNVKNQTDEMAKAVDDMVSKMKSAMNFTWSLPHLSVPHINISGSWSLKDPVSAPSFSVSWYKDGGVFNSAQLIGIGEAGTEYALRPKHLDEIADKMAKRRGGSEIDYEKLASSVAAAVSGIGFYVGSDRLATATAASRDAVDGRIAVLAGRGLDI